MHAATIFRKKNEDGFQKSEDAASAECRVPCVVDGLIKKSFYFVLF